MKVRVTGTGKRRVIRITATRKRDLKTLMRLIEALAAPQTSSDRQLTHSLCEDCGCVLATTLGGLETHKVGCSNFPL